MKLSYSSKLLVLMGKYIYGDPKGFGVDCSAEEFYALESERPIVNQNLHPQHAGDWHNMRKQLFINQMRLVVLKHLAYFSLALSLSVLAFGTLANKGMVKIGEQVSQLSHKFHTSSSTTSDDFSSLSANMKDYEQTLANISNSDYSNNQEKGNVEAIKDIFNDKILELSIKANTATNAGTITKNEASDLYNDFVEIIKSASPAVRHYQKSGALSPADYQKLETSIHKTESNLQLN